MKYLKIVSLLTVLIFSASGIYAQATVTSTIIEKENRDAIMIKIDQPVDITMSALEQQLKGSGLNGKTNNHVTTYREVTLSEISPEKVDIYTKVEEGANNNSSVVYMAVSKGYDNFTNGVSDDIITENVKTFLNSFAKYANAFSADVTITSQTEEVSDDEKEYERLLSDQKDLEKKQADIESSLRDITNQIIEKRAEIDSKKVALEGLKSKKNE